MTEHHLGGIGASCQEESAIAQIRPDVVVDFWAILREPL
jgi:hypothetical protein